MRRFFAGLLFLFASMAPASAQTDLVVVELYTSAGCSSCPPADAILTKLGKRDGILPLALHVDYWDYIGWKDEFGSPQYSQRQRSYARATGARVVYTPQMIIGGKDHMVGSHGMEIADAVNAHLAADRPVELEISRKGARVEIAASMRKPGRRPMIVQLVRYKPNSVVNITRGENAGRTIDYTYIVTDWREIDTWNGARPLEIDARAPGNDPVVVIIQEAGPGPILAAARLR